MSQAAEPKADAGLGALGREVADDAVRLVHAEIDLAKAQFKDAARRLIVAVVLIVAASVLLLIAGIEALGALPIAFSQRLFGNPWLGWVALGGVIAVLAALLALLGTFLLLRGRLRREEPERGEPASLEEVAAELRDIRRALEKHNGTGGSVAQKALLRALSAAGTAGGTYLARRMVAQRRDAAPEEGAEAARAG